MLLINRVIQSMESRKTPNTPFFMNFIKWKSSLNLFASKYCHGKLIVFSKGVASKGLYCLSIKMEWKYLVECNWPRRSRTIRSVVVTIHIYKQKFILFPINPLYISIYPLGSTYMYHHHSSPACIPQCTAELACVSMGFHWVNHLFCRDW